MLLCALCELGREPGCPPPKGGGVRLVVAKLTWWWSGTREKPAVLGKPKGTSGGSGADATLYEVYETWAADERPCPGACGSPGSTETLVADAGRDEP